MLSTLIVFRSAMTRSGEMGNGGQVNRPQSDSSDNKLQLSTKAPSGDR